MKKWIAKYYRLIIAAAIIGAAANTLYTARHVLFGDGSLSGLEIVSVAASLGGIALLALALGLSVVDSRRKEKNTQKEEFPDAK